MNIGDAVFTTSVIHIGQTPKLRFEKTTRAKRGVRFACLLMGACKKGKESEFDFEAVLISMGWVFDPERAARYCHE